MKAFFKDTDKLIVNSMTYDEALVGKQFLNNLTGKSLKAEQRNDINDDFDGLVLTVSDEQSQSEEEIQKRIEEAIAKYEESKNKEFTIDLNKESKEQGTFVISNADNVQVISDIFANVIEHGVPALTLLVGEDTIKATTTVCGIDYETDPTNPIAYVSFKAENNNIRYTCNFDKASGMQPIVEVFDPSENQT